MPFGNTEDDLALSSIVRRSSLSAPPIFITRETTRQTERVKGWIRKETERGDY